MQGFKIGIVWSLNCVGFAFWKIWTHPVFHILFFNEGMQNHHHTMEPLYGWWQVRRESRERTGNEGEKRRNRERKKRG